MKEPIPDHVELVGKDVVDAAFKIHAKYGPGLFEGVYEICLAHELRLRGHKVDRQVVIPIIYEGVKIEAGLRIDMIVDGCLIVETKSVEKMIPVFDAQLLSYLKLTELRLGLLINFNVPLDQRRHQADRELTKSTLFCSLCLRAFVPWW